MSLPEGYHEDLLRSVIAGRPWLIAYDVLVPAAAMAQQLRALGAGPCLALGAWRGTGSVPAEVEHLALGVSAGSMMEGIRAAERALRDLPPKVQARIQAFDPERRARVIRPLHAGPGSVAGRRPYGERRPAWLALEDKTVVDALWDAVGLARAPSRIVPAEAAPLREAAAALDAGHGTVWAGDNRSGWHGGASCLRWVRAPAEARAAQAFFAASCGRVRVMPFLEGIPCSIHGIVFPERVVALRPCEMLVLRRPGASSFLYAAAATFWDPPPAARAAMRAAARRVGAHLRERVGYRGVFTIDGILTSEGFRPTELNPRYGAALSVMTQGLARLPLYLLHLALVEGEAFDWRAEALESFLLEHADRERAGRVGTVAPARLGEPVDEGLVYAEGGFRRARGDEPPDAQLAIGPHPAGCYLRGALDPARTPRGPSAAPRAVALLAYADATYGLGFGPLEPASDLRAFSG